MTGETATHTWMVHVIFAHTTTVKIVNVFFFSIAGFETYLDVHRNIGGIHLLKITLWSHQVGPSDCVLNGSLVPLPPICNLLFQTNLSIYQITLKHCFFCCYFKVQNLLLVVKFVSQSASVLPSVGESQSESTEFLVYQGQAVSPPESLFIWVQVQVK